MSTAVIVIIFVCLAVICYLVWENDRAIWDIKESTTQSHSVLIESFNDLRQDLIKHIDNQSSVNEKVNDRLMKLETHQAGDDRSNPEQNERMKIIEMSLADKDKEISELKTDIINLKTVLAFKTSMFGG